MYSRATWHLAGRMVTTLEGETLAIANNAAAPVSSEAALLSPTKRFSGRMGQRAGSQYCRYSSNAVTMTWLTDVSRAARAIAVCRGVADSPRLQYWAGAL